MWPPGWEGVWGRMDTCICMTESLGCSPKMITTLLIGYTPIQNKKFQKSHHCYHFSEYISKEHILFQFTNDLWCQSIIYKDIYIYIHVYKFVLTWAYICYTDFCKSIYNSPYATPYITICLSSMHEDVKIKYCFAYFVFWLIIWNINERRKETWSV